MSSSNCCFLTCIQVSQKAGQVVWNSHLFKYFSQLVVIYTVKGFGIVNKTEIDVFLELSCFFDDPKDVGKLISHSSTFLNPAWTSGSSQFTYCWSLVWKILRIPLLACEMSAIVRQFEHSLALPFFVIGMKTDLSQAFGHCWVFQICWHIECSTFTASSFRIWNSSTVIPSPLLALFVVMLPKAHLTLHSRMSGFRWVIIPLWLSGLWRSFLYSSSTYSYHLFLVSSASVRSTPFLSFIVCIFAWNVPLVSLIFLKRSLIFPILMFSSISLHLLFLKVQQLWHSAASNFISSIPLCKFSHLVQTSIFLFPKIVPLLLLCSSLLSKAFSSLA